jgi:hypothetical protein
MSFNLREMGDESSIQMRQLWQIKALLFIRKTATLGINDQFNETLRITNELETMPQAVNFIKQIVLLLAHGGSSTVNTLNQTSFHMWRMVRLEAEIFASVGGVPVDSVGQCRLFPDDQNIQKGNRTVWLYFHGLKLLRWLRKFCNHSGPWGQTTNVSSMYRSYSNVLCRVKSQFLKMLHEDAANNGW